MKEVLSRLQAQFPMRPLDPGEYAAFSAPPLAVRLEWYAAGELGNVCLLHGTAMAGLMQMDTLVINAAMRDVPLFSYDYISAMGNHTVIVEYYDTMLCPEAFSAEALLPPKASIAQIPENGLGEHWYDGMKLPASFSKKVKKRALPEVHAAFLSALDTYLTLASHAPLLSAAEQVEKQQKTVAYVEGLLEKGGPSTDAFIKAIGPARTRDLFTQILFGTVA